MYSPKQICETLDSTLTIYMHDEGGKLATIYASLKKEEKIIEQQQFGDDRLMDIMRNTPYMSAQQMINRLQNEVVTHRREADPNDDITMLFCAAREPLSSRPCEQP